MNHLQPRAEKRLETLGSCTGQAIRTLDFSDDRLGHTLRALSDDDHYARDCQKRRGESMSIIESDTIKEA